MIEPTRVSSLPWDLEYRLGFEGSVLILRNRPGVEQLLRLCDLASRIRVAIILRELLAGALRALGRAFGHRISLGNQIHEHADVGENECDDEPQSLHPP